MLRNSASLALEIAVGTLVHIAVGFGDEQGRTPGRFRALRESETLATSEDRHAPSDPLKPNTRVAV